MVYSPLAPLGIPPTDIHAISWNECLGGSGSSSGCRLNVTKRVEGGTLRETGRLPMPLGAAGESVESFGPLWATLYSPARYGLSASRLGVWRGGTRVSLLGPLGRPRPPASFQNFMRTLGNAEAQYEPLRTRLARDTTGQQFTF
jgi:hypothetical protein